MKTKPKLKDEDFFKKNKYFNIIYLVHWANTQYPPKKIKKKHLKVLVRNYYDPDKTPLDELDEIINFYEKPYKNETCEFWDKKYKKGDISKKELHHIHEHSKSVLFDLDEDFLFDNVGQLSKSIHILKRHDIIRFIEDNNKSEFHSYKLTDKAEIIRKRYFLLLLIKRMNNQELKNKYYKIMEIISK